MRHWTEKDDRGTEKDEARADRESTEPRDTPPPDPDRALIKRFLLLALVPLTLGVVGGLFAGWLIWGRQ